jgi:hypothetical protein
MFPIEPHFIPYLLPNIVLLQILGLMSSLHPSQAIWEAKNMSQKIFPIKRNVVRKKCKYKIICK